MYMPTSKDVLQFREFLITQKIIIIGNVLSRFSSKYVMEDTMVRSLIEASVVPKNSFFLFPMTLR